MKSLSTFIAAIALLAACQTARPKQSDTIILPQWHLSPSTNTKSQQEVPQAQNQIAIYEQVVKWVDDGKLKSVVVEGCEGEIATGFAVPFNGWTLADLEKMKADNQNIDGIITQVGLKLEARFGKEIDVVCGDSLELIEKHGLVLSDLRGLLGFKSRIELYADQPEKKNSYLQTLRGLLKAPDEATDKEVMQKLRAKMREKLDEFKLLIKERNKAFAQAAQSSRKPVAVVIGALHVGDLEEKIKGARVHRAPGLPEEEGKLIEQLESLL